MIIDNQAQVTDAVLEAMNGATNPRLREVMAAFVRHMHDFVRETRLTEQEWEQGVEFLNRIGGATHDLHNEGILFSDAIGVSTLVCLLNNGDAGATENASALLGPFWRLGAPETANGDSIVRSETTGRPCLPLAALPTRRGAAAGGGGAYLALFTPRASTRTKTPNKRR